MGIIDHIKAKVWREFVSRAAKSRGFINPLDVMVRLRQFAQPSEVQEPIELLRAGARFHARGLLNARAIQNNLDWIWPYWVNRQFDPGDPAFVPRGFSITNTNLTHRNWTAVGAPGEASYPVVDPRGLLTPLFDGWSIDAWIKTDDGASLIPAQARECSQELNISDNQWVIETRTRSGGLHLFAQALMEVNSEAVCVARYEAGTETGGWLFLALRPYNPEGLSLVDEIRISGREWRVGDGSRVMFNRNVERHYTSEYHDGDVWHSAPDGLESDHTICPVGMATAAALFRISPGKPLNVELRIPLPREALPTSFSAKAHSGSAPATTWPDALAGTATVESGNPTYDFLYNAAIRSLVMHSPHEVYPGPYTYRRFWFRDAAFILHAMLCAGLAARSRRVLDTYPERQTRAGYFHSQDGEWDSNGEALWIMQRYCQLANERPPESWLRAIRSGARWISRKRMPRDAGELHDGLLPAGFSAEHLGPNDYYYWDDLWAVAGLHAAAGMLRADGAENEADHYAAEAQQFRQTLITSLAASAERIGRPAMPASPYRRLDAGAIGSIVASYPLRLLGADDERILDTVKYLREYCMVQGAFFHNVIHSGLNAYLTLHIAQVLLRAGIPDFSDLVEAVARLATPTGQWPEAIHPGTGGGCMGDGQHIWAVAEWVMMMRNMFVYEEEEALVLAAGVTPAMLDARGYVRFGPTLTRFGKIEVDVSKSDCSSVVTWKTSWYRAPPRLSVRLPGHVPIDCGTSETNKGKVRVDRL